MLLLSVDTAKLTAEVRVENLDCGTNEFPHVYGPLPNEAVVKIDPLAVGDDGRLIVPDLADGAG